MSDYKYLKYKNKYINLKNINLKNINLKNNMVGGNFDALLQRIRSNDPTLTTLNLTSPILNVFQGRALIEALKHNNTIETLNISQNNIFEYRLFREALKHNNNLRNLNLSGTRVSVFAGDPSSLYRINREYETAELINNTNITHLNISNIYNTYTMASADIVAQRIAEVLKHNTTFLTNLDLSYNKISDIGAQAIATALRHNTTLTTLNLSYNNISEVGEQAIATALKHNTTLTTLNLSNNNLSDVGLQYITEALTINTTLTTLNLSRMNLSEVGIRAIANALRHNRTLTHLTFFSDNHDRLAMELLPVLEEHNFTLTNLNLSGYSPTLDRIELLCNENRRFKKKFIDIFQKIRPLIAGMISRTGTRLPDELWDMYILQFNELTPRELRYYTYLKEAPCLCRNLSCTNTGDMPCFIYNILKNKEGRLTREELSQTPVPKYPLSRILLDATAPQTMAPTASRIPPPVPPKSYKLKIAAAAAAAADDENVD